MRSAVEYSGLQLVSVTMRSVGCSSGWCGTGASTSTVSGRHVLEVAEAVGVPAVARLDDDRVAELQLLDLVHAAAIGVRCAAIAKLPTSPGICVPG